MYRFSFILIQPSIKKFTCMQMHSLCQNVPIITLCQFENNYLKKETILGVLAAYKKHFKLLKRLFVIIYYVSNSKKQQ